MQLDAPIILAHGIARFDEVFALLRKKTGVDAGPRYFNGIRDHLRAKGFDAYETFVEFAASVETRSQSLREQILSVTNKPKVHIIAHSMGGLDARHMIVDLGMADHVASLTTIATPHNGLILADELLGAGASKLVSALKPYVDLDGFRDLTVTACAAFNERARESEAANAVRYVAVSAHETKARKVFTPLVPAWHFINKHAGPNDGLVPVSSQEWTPELVAGATRKRIEIQQFPFPADHLNEMGWWPGVLFSSRRENLVRAFYESLARNATST